ncbi:Uncharacterised protein [uncultured archaeon]|nr:Uncharacterised protein [uncultured archaeon]
MILTFPLGLNPSISESSCINVRWTSRSPDVAESTLFAPMESSSSMNIMLGDFSFAILKRSLTSRAPSPIYFCTSSEPTILINVAFVWFATAFASRDFPVPGAPYNNIPLGGSIPIRSNTSGFVSGSSTVSRSSRIGSSRPPISEYETSGDSMTSIPCTNGSLDDGRIPTTARLW